MPENEFVSVVVPTYNGEKRISKTLSLFVYQSYPFEDFELIVVDDGSSDGTGIVLEKYPADFNFKYIINKENRGRASARNAGIRMARGGTIILIDDDMVFPPDFILNHVNYYQADKRIAVVGMVRLNPSLAWSVFGKRLIQQQEEGIRKNLQRRHDLPFSSSATGNFSVQKDILLEVGMFDESFSVYGFEDWDLGYRLHKAGIRLLYAPEACSIHNLSINDFEKFCKRRELVGYSAVTFYEKHPELRSLLEVDSVCMSSGNSIQKLKKIIKTLLINFFTIPLYRLFIFLWERIRGEGLNFLYDQISAYYYRRGLKTGLEERQIL